MRRIIVLLCGYAFLLCGAFSSAVAETSVFAEGDATVAPLVAKPDKLIPVPLMRQGRDYTCGVACVQALLRYAGYAFDVREDILLAPLGTTPEDGTPLSGIVDFLNQYKVRSLITTHYSMEMNCRKLRVKGFTPHGSKEKITVQNINSYIDYSLEETNETEVPHEAIKIAEIIGVDSELLEYAKNYLKH